jgi:hypothetical protein
MQREMIRAISFIADSKIKKSAEKDMHLQKKEFVKKIIE